MRLAEVQNPRCALLVFATFASFDPVPRRNQITSAGVSTSDESRPRSLAGNVIRGALASPVRGGLTSNGDESAHTQLGGLIEFARSTRV